MKNKKYRKQFEISLLLGPFYAKNSNRYITTPCTFLKDTFFRNSLKKTSKSNPCTYNRLETSIFCILRPIVMKRVGLQYPY